MAPAVDRISALEDALLLRILSFLETHTAAKTTLLSRRWLGLWTRLSNLNFHLYSECVPSMASIDKILQLPASTGTRKINIHEHFNARHAPTDRLNRLVGFAATHPHVEILHLLLHRSDFQLPPSFYSLTELKTVGCAFITKVDWHSLRVLEISGGNFRSKVLVGCPSLECLVLRGVSIKGRLRIVNAKLKKLVLAGILSGSHLHVSAPQLEEFCISGNWLWNSSHLTEAPSLLHAGLGLLRFDSINKDAMKNLLQMIRHSKEVVLGISCLKVIANMTMVSWYAPRWECLMLTSLRLDWFSDWIPPMTSLVPYSPNLTSFIVKFEDSRPFVEQFDFMYGMMRNGFLNCKNASVKNVEIHGFVNRFQCLHFVKFLLKKLKVLEKISIFHKLCDGSLLQMSLKMLELPRSSPQAQVIFLKKDD